MRLSFKPKHSRHDVGVGGVCDMYMCLARIRFGLYLSWRNRGRVGYVFAFWWRAVMLVVLGGMGGRLGPGSGRMG